MAGYWPCSFFASLWTLTRSWSISMQKENLAKIQPFWPDTWSINLIYYFLVTTLVLLFNSEIKQCLQLAEVFSLITTAFFSNATSYWTKHLLTSWRTSIKLLKVALCISTAIGLACGHCCFLTICFKLIYAVYATWKSLMCGLRVYTLDKKLDCGKITWAFFKFHIVLKVCCMPNTRLWDIWKI